MCQSITQQLISYNFKIVYCIWSKLLCYRLTHLCILYMSKHFGLANTKFKDGVCTATTRCRRWRWCDDRACIYTRSHWRWPKSVNRLGKAPRWRISVSTAPVTFSLSCTSHLPLSPVIRFISDFHELVTSTDEHKRLVGETELPVSYNNCVVGGACGSNLSCVFFLGYTSLSERHLGHYLYVDHGGVRPTLYVLVSHRYQILTPRDLTIWNSICTFLLLLALQPPMGVVFYSPLVGFSLLVYEVSWSHTTTRHSR